jgi:hypothetical protein
MSTYHLGQALHDITSIPNTYIKTVGSTVTSVAKTAGNVINHTEDSAVKVVTHTEDAVGKTLTSPLVLLAIGGVAVLLIMSRR